MIKKSLLFKLCLGLSLSMHGALLWIVYSQPLFLRPYFSAILSKGVFSETIPFAEEDIALSERNIALEEAFSQITRSSSYHQRPYDSVEMLAVRHGIDPLVEEATLAKWEIQLPSKEVEGSLATQEVSLPLSSEDAMLPFDLQVKKVTPKAPSVAIEAQPHFSYVASLEARLALVLAMESDRKAPSFKFSHLHEKPDLPFESIAKSGHVLTSLISVDPSLATPIPSELSEGDPESLRVEGKIAHVPFASLLPGDRAPLFTSYALPLGEPEVSWDELFDVEVRTFAQEEGGYLFSVTLVPRLDLEDKKLTQNYYFLIDRSSSIEKFRYQSFKKAVLRALHSFEPGARFNIYLLDGKIKRLSDTPLTFSKKTLQKAEAFLASEEIGGYFAGGDICTTLAQFPLPEAAMDEVNTAILITDGDTNLNAARQRKAIDSWLKRSSNKMVLYTAAVGKGNNNAFLELLATASRGSFLYSDTHASFPRKLAKLGLDLRKPVAKDLMITLSQVDPESKLQLAPLSGNLPCLFSDKALTFYGSAERLSNFTITLQGQSKDKIFMVSKEISFAHVKTGASGLIKEWPHREAEICYTEYLRTGNVAKLERAEKLLK